MQTMWESKSKYFSLTPAKRGPSEEESPKNYYWPIWKWKGKKVERVHVFIK